MEFHLSYTYILADHKVVTSSHVQEQPLLCLPPSIFICTWYQLCDPFESQSCQLLVQLIIDHMPHSRMYATVHTISC